MRLLPAALSLLAFAAAPASASAAVYQDRDGGYRLSVHPSDKQQGARLTIPKAKSGGTTFFFVNCAKSFAKKGELLLGISPVTSSRTLKAPILSSFSPKRRACKLTIGDDPKPVARFKLKRL